MTFKEYVAYLKNLAEQIKIDHIKFESMCSVPEDHWTLDDLENTIKNIKSESGINPHREP